MCKKKYEFEFFWCRTIHSAIIQIYRGGNNPEKTTDPEQVTGKLYHIRKRNTMDYVVEETTRRKPPILGKSLIDYITIEKEIRWITWWRKSENPVRIIDSGQTIGKLEKKKYDGVCCLFTREIYTVN